MLVLRMKFEFVQTHCFYTLSSDPIRLNLVMGTYTGTTCTLKGLYPVSKSVK